MIAAIISMLSMSTKADAHSDSRLDLRPAFMWEGFLKHRTGRCAVLETCPLCPVTSDSSLRQVLNFRDTMLKSPLHIYTFFVDLNCF